MNLAELKNAFGEKHPKSGELFHRSSEWVAGGVNGNLRYFEPFPLTFNKAQGAWLEDVDGYRYVDYLLSYGCLMLGHGHPLIRKTLEEVWQTYGTSSFGAAHPLESEISQTIQRLYPGFERLRFTNSGLEATLFALRLAIAYTGKTHIAKFEGHYHGSHDQVLISVKPEPGAAGNPDHPSSVPDSYGMPDYYLQHTVVLPFNDWPGCERILTEGKDRIAAVIMEPLQDGYIPADVSFMKQLRELTRKLGIALIFDEVKTGFRITLGGAQAYYGVQPDLSALGKVVGGGFPIGIVGGVKEIMELASPLHSTRQQDVVFHSGTFNGNPVSLAAGLATINYLEENGRFEKMVERTMRLRKAIETLAENYHLPIQTLGVGTIFNVLFSEKPIANYRDLSRNRKDWRLMLDFLLMDHGVYTKPLNRFSMSDAHGEQELQVTIDAFEKSFAALKKEVAISL